MSTPYYHFIDRNDIPKLSLFVCRPCVMINSQWFELPMSRTNFHGRSHRCSNIEFDCILKEG